MSLTSLWKVAAAALVAVVMSVASAQATLLTARSDRPGVVVARTSIDAGGTPTASDFALHLDAATVVAASSIAPVAAGPQTAVLMLCIDRSGSMGAPALADIRDVLGRVLVPRPGETGLPLQVAILAFGTRTTRLLEPTADPARVAAALGGLALEREREGRTRLHDAVAGAVAELRTSDATWRHVLVISDGNDEGSTLSQQALIRLATDPVAINIDSIGFGALASSSSGSLATLAGATEGRFAVAQTRADLGGVLTRVIRQIVPRPTFDVSFHYPAASDQRLAEAVSLVYSPPGTASVTLPLAVPLAAAATAAATATGTASTPAAADTGGSATKFDWKLLLNVRWVIVTVARWNPAILAAAILGLVVLLAIAWFLWHRRRERADLSGGDEPTILPPAPAPAPTGFREPAPAPVRGPRVTVVGHPWPAPGTGAGVALLHGLTGAAHGRSFVVRQPVTRLGAAADNDLALSGDDFVSGHHAKLNAEAGSLYLVDLESRNGSELNGQRVTGSTRSLLPGDRITLGKSSFEVREASTEPGVDAARGEPRTR